MASQGSGGDKGKGKERSRREFYHSVRNDMAIAAEAECTRAGISTASGHVRYFYLFIKFKKI